MKELVMIVRPEKLEVVKGIIDKMSLGGMTVGTVMGCGAQKGAPGADEQGSREIRGLKTTINLIPKIRISLIVEDRHVDEVVREVCESCATGRPGDSTVFVRNIEAVIRIRTGERGEWAL